MEGHFGSFMSWPPSLLQDVTESHHCPHSYLNTYQLAALLAPKKQVEEKMKPRLQILGNVSCGGGAEKIVSVNGAADNSLTQEPSLMLEQQREGQDETRTNCSC